MAAGRFRFGYRLFGFIALLALSGCDGRTVPYEAWRLGVLAPNYMEVWLEDATVLDIKGQVYRGAMKGVVAMGEPASLSATAVGWPKGFGAGKGRYLNGLDLPSKVQVRWQSMVEPQTYSVLLDIPKWARQEMAKRHKVDCRFSERTTDYRELFTIGLAPGGIVKVWIMGACLEPIEVMRVQAEVEPKGPYGGLSDGHYRPLSEVPKAYIEKHGVPYGSW